MPWDQMDAGCIVLEQCVMKGRLYHRVSVIVCIERCLLQLLKGQDSPLYVSHGDTTGQELLEWLQCPCAIAALLLLIMEVTQRLRQGITGSLP